MRCCLSFLRILGILFGGFGAACASYSRGYLKSRKFRTFLQTRLDSTLKNIPRLCRGVRKTVNVNKNSCKAAQGTQSLVRNIMTQNSPDIQVSGLFGLTEHNTGSTCIEVRRCTVVSVRQIEIDFINDIDYSPHKSSSYCADNSAQQLQV